MLLPSTQPFAVWETTCLSIYSNGGWGGDIIPVDSSPLVHVYNNECVLYVICIVCVCCVWKVYTLDVVYIYPVYIPSSEMGVSLSQYFVVVCRHTPLELYTYYTWYLVRSDGVKIGVPGLQRVNGQMFIMRSLIWGCVPYINAGIITSKLLIKWNYETINESE